MSNSPRALRRLIASVFSGDIVKGRYTFYRHFPWFLLVVRLATQFLGIHTEFASHLDMGMGKMVSLSCLNPCLEFLWNFLLFRHSSVEFLHSPLASHFSTVSSSRPSM